MCRMISVLLLVLTAASSGWCAELETGPDALRRLLSERLGLMEQVAAYKWNNGLAVDDPAREANVLSATSARARAAGLEPEAAQRFVVAQMEAAKMVQRAYFERWRQEGVGAIPGVSDLKTELRPKIGALSSELIVHLAKSRKSWEPCQAVKILLPVPASLNDVPRAWTVAVEGVFPEGRALQCP